MPTNPNDPFGAIGDPFQMQRSMPELPTARPITPSRMRRAVPEVDELFVVQKALVRAINYLDRVESDDPDIQRAEERTKGAYRRLRNWLNEHGNQWGGM